MGPSQKRFISVTGGPVLRTETKKVPESFLLIIEDDRRPETHESCNIPSSGLFKIHQMTLAKRSEKQENAAEMLHDVCVF